ncbi:PREDICTED: uncharacterized protein LOC105566012 [Vollenhovia emeryi]|uniref:uncharacterized protein LOC105566012 n=1 Tax=Vollenhovia emeryi TaxID=411798 RepID=UPI0005F57DF3|nr:PREDICTED: uncharacterized protein LOC105566012 [Vollenhovia emeryi]
MLIYSRTNVFDREVATRDLTFRGPMRIPRGTPRMSRARHVACATLQVRFSLPDCAYASQIRSHADGIRAGCAVTGVPQRGHLIGGEGGSVVPAACDRGGRGSSLKKSPRLRRHFRGDRVWTARQRIRWNSWQLARTEREESDNDPPSNTFRNFDLGDTN